MSIATIGTGFIFFVIGYLFGLWYARKDQEKEIVRR